MPDRSDGELHNLVRDAVRAGVRDAIDDLVRDESEFGRLTGKLYGGLSEHATNSLSQWIGKRVLMILLAAALSGSIAWAVMTGRFK